MLRGLFFAIFLLFGAPAHAQADARAVSSFKTMVAAASKTALFTDAFFNKTDNGWRKSYVYISDISYDVRKTDSAINPLVGEVSLLTLQKTSSPYPSKELARGSTDMVEVTLSRKFSITYQLDGGKWKASRALYDTALIGGKVPGSISRGTAYKLKPKADMHALDKALEKWLPGLN